MRHKITDQKQIGHSFSQGAWLSWSPTRAHGPTVVAITGMPLWQRFLQQWLVAVRFDFSADTYYRYRLYQLDHIGDAVLFFPLNVHMTLRNYLYAHLNMDVTRLEDKRDFYRICAKHDRRSLPPLRVHGRRSTCMGRRQ